MATNKDLEDMSRYIQNWMKSRKYAQVRKELDLRQAELSELKTLNKEQLLLQMKDKFLKRKELLQIVNDIIAFDSLNSDEKEELIWISDVNLYNKNKEELYLYFIRGLINWYMYIYIYQVIEDYEMCQLLKQVIEIDKREMVSNINDYFEFEPEDEVKMAQIEQDIIAEILLK